MLKTMSRYPEVVQLAAEQRAPALVVHYLRDLANDFHTYYNAPPVHRGRSADPQRAG